ncbi:MAG: peptidase, partial [Haloarculaceae archaeon]
AILRPGRFDRLIEVPKPEQEGRQRILEIHTADMNLDGELDLAAIATDTDEFSGAELASLATEAGMFAIRDGRTEVRTADFEDALEKITDENRDETGPIAFY